MSATSYATEDQEIHKRLDTQWTRDEPIAWPNDDFQPTDDTPYVEVIINRQEAFNVDIAAAKRIRHPGLITFNVRVPLREGNGRALEMADVLVAAFRNVSFSGIVCMAPTVVPQGQEGAWYRLQVDVPYWRDSIH